MSAFTFYEFATFREVQPKLLAPRRRPRPPSQVMKRSVWTAPAVERAAATLLASLPATYRPAVDFQLLTRESGSVRHDLPIWVSTPHIIRWSDAYGPVQRHDVPGVQGAFVLSNVLAVDECEQILRLSEAMGYTEHAP